MKGSLPHPASQAIKRGARLPTCFDGISHGSSCLPDGLSSSLDGVLRLTKLGPTNGRIQRLAFTDHESFSLQTKTDARARQSFQASAVHGSYRELGDRPPEGAL